LYAILEDAILCLGCLPVELVGVVEVCVLDFLDLHRITLGLVSVLSSVSFVSDA